MSRPFVYIASLRRTGSTVLSEALTQLPYAFIFREPSLGRGQFSIKEADRELWNAHGVDLHALTRRLVRASEPVRCFRDEVLPRLLAVVEQVGIKEIRHAGWDDVQRTFPDMRVLITGRDPRDVFVSLHHRIREGRRWPGAFTPESVADDLMGEFRHQLAMLDQTDAMKVRYEDFCADPAVFEAVKRFVRTPIPTMGAVGAFNTSNPKRTAEADMHAGRVTDVRVARWRTDPDPAVREAAARMPALMPDYCRFWGYQA